MTRPSPDPQHLMAAIAASSGDVIYAKDVQGRLVFANPAALGLIGKPAEQVLGHTDAEFLDDKAAAAAVMRNDRRVIDFGETLEVEEVVPRPDGSEAVWASRKTPYRDEAGRIVGLLGISRDITERKRIERERELLAGQRQLALDAAGMGWWHYDPLSRTASFDQRYCEIFGVEGREKPNEEILRLLHPDDLPRVWEQVEAALDPVSPRPYHCQYRIRRPDGQLRWIEAHGLAVFGQRNGVRTATSFVGTVQDITGRKSTEQELHKAQQLLQSTMDHFPTVIAFKDREGRFIEANKAVLDILGRPRAQVLGLGAADLLDAATAREIADVERQVMQDRSSRQVERSRTVHGRRWMFLDTVFPLITGSGEVYGVGYISHDLTAVKEAQQALASANEELRAGARQKDILLATLAHELRNPLAPLRTVAAILEHRSDAATIAKVRSVIDRQVSHLVRLVDDLLDVSQVTGGQVQLRPERLDLAQLAALVTGRFQDEAASRGVSLWLAPPGDRPVVSADEGRLSQCIGSLLQNALKFTPARGRVEVRVGRRAATAFVEVRDTGAGIEPANLERIFGLFVQDQPSGMNGQSGFGIGLALTRRLMELHGGSVKASSEGLGRGASFTLELPLVALADDAGVHAAHAAHQAPVRDANEPRRRRILVVDDNHDAAVSTSELLLLHGFDAAIALTGADALGRAASWQPDLVLLDIGLPDISGYEVCRRIRADSSFGKPVLVAHTGWSQDADRQLAAEAGFDLHMAKPVDTGQLLRQVESFLQQRAGP
jgi:PAS domain S-box-containing protein